MSRGATSQNYSRTPIKQIPRKILVVDKQLSHGYTSIALSTHYVELLKTTISTCGSPAGHHHGRNEGMRLGDRIGALASYSCLIAESARNPAAQLDYSPASWLTTPEASWFDYESGMFGLRYWYDMKNRLALLMQWKMSAYDGCHENGKSSRRESKKIFDTFRNTVLASQRISLEDPSATMQSHIMQSHTHMMDSVLW